MKTFFHALSHRPWAAGPQSVIIIVVRIIVVIRAVVVIGRERLREWEAKDGTKGKSLEVQATAIAKVPPLPKRNGTLTTQPQQSAPQQWGQAPAQADPWSGGQQSAWPSEQSSEVPF